MTTEILFQKLVLITAKYGLLPIEATTWWECHSMPVTGLAVVCTPTGQIIRIYAEDGPTNYEDGVYAIENFPAEDTK